MHGTMQSQFNPVNKILSYGFRFLLQDYIPKKKFTHQESSSHNQTISRESVRSAAHSPSNPLNRTPRYRARRAIGAKASSAKAQNGKKIAARRGKTEHEEQKGLWCCSAHAAENQKIKGRLCLIDVALLKCQPLVLLFLEAERKRARG